MKTIFDSTRPVKTSPKPFGAGLVLNPRREGYTASDLAWAAANLNASSRQYEVISMSDAAIEQAAGCAMAQARMDAGFSPF